MKERIRETYRAIDGGEGMLAREEALIRYKEAHAVSSEDKTARNLRVPFVNQVPKLKPMYQPQHDPPYKSAYESQDRPSHREQAGTAMAGRHGISAGHFSKIWHPVTPHLGDPVALQRNGDLRFQGSGSGVSQPLDGVPALGMAMVRDDQGVQREVRVLALNEEELLVAEMDGSGKQTLVPAEPRATRAQQHATHLLPRPVRRDRRTRHRP